MAVTVDDIVDYIGVDAAVRWAEVDDEDVTTYPQIADALATETVVQLGKVCYRPDIENDDDTTTPADNSDLEEALKRRVQRNLAMRALPLAVQTNTETGTVTRPASSDPEIRRLEAERRKLVAG
jgi:hypothetical protein